MVKKIYLPGNARLQWKDPWGRRRSNTDSNVYWNAMPTDVLPHQGGIMKFDKTKEQYYFDVIKQIESL